MTLLIAGDPAYPLLLWLMKGFSGPNLSEEKLIFSEQLSRIHVKVECAFGHLKAGRRVLAKCSDIHHSFMPTVVVACCVLHYLREKETQMLLLPAPPVPGTTLQSLSGQTKQHSLGSQGCSCSACGNQGSPR